jgi:hypothetical protein
VWGMPALVQICTANPSDSCLIQTLHRRVGFRATNTHTPTKRIRATNGLLQTRVMAQVAPPSQSKLAFLVFADLCRSVAGGAVSRLDALEMQPI